jgi:hypothetical protein
MPPIQAGLEASPVFIFCQEPLNNVGMEVKLCQLKQNALK